MPDNLATAVIAAAAGIGGAVLGVAGGALERRLQWAADREARREERQAKRDELQRQTLIEFQEVLGRCVRGVGKTLLHDLGAAKQAGRPVKTLLPPGLSDELFEDERRLRQLSLRVRDDDLRRLFHVYEGKATKLGMLHPDVKDPDAYMISEVVPAIQALEQRLGEVLRPHL